MQKRALGGGMFDGSDYRNAGGGRSALPGTGWLDRAATPKPTAPPVTPAKPSTSTPQASQQPKPPAPQQQTGGGMFDLSSPQTFGMMAGMFKPVTQAVLSTGGMPGLMGIYGKLTGNKDWATATAPNHFYSGTSRLYNRPTAPRPLGDYPPPKEVLASVRLPLPVADGNGLKMPGEKRAIGEDWGLDSSMPSTATAPLPSKPSPAPALQAPAEAEAETEAAQPQIPKWALPNPHAHDLRAALPADMLMTRGWNHAAKSAPWMGQMWKASPVGASRLARVGTLGRNLTAGALPYMFAADFADILGVNPIGQRQFGSGVMGKEEATLRGERLAGEGAGIRALHGATAPLSTIYQGGALASAALDDTRSATAAMDRALAMQRRSLSEPRFGSSADQEVREIKARRASEWAPGLKDINPIEYMIHPERAGENTTVALAEREAQGQRRAWDSWANNYAKSLEGDHSPEAQRELINLRMHQTRNNIFPPQQYGETPQLKKWREAQVASRSKQLRTQTEDEARIKRLEAWAQYYGEK